MSAQECQQPTCPGCPLMVSRDGKESFCARCDGGAKVGLPRPGLVEPLANSLSTTAKIQTRASSPTSSRDGEPADLLADLDTAPNTPPTPQSHLPSPPLPQEPQLSALDPVQAANRREQSDRASALVGQKLLQGWALLDAQCTNEACYAVPLMRRPAQIPKRSDNAQDGDSKATVKKLIDPRRHCVVCSRDYLKEGELGAYEDFVQATQVQSAGAVQASTSGMSPQDLQGGERGAYSAAAKKRKFSTQPAPSVPKTQAAATVAHSAKDSGKGKQKATDASEMKSSSSSNYNSKPVTASTASNRSNASAIASGQPTSTPSTSAAAAVTALEKAVFRLAEHLESITEKDTAGENVEALAIADAAEALARTCRSLSDVASL